MMHRLLTSTWFILLGGVGAGGAGDLGERGMIQVQYLKQANCEGCGRVGCLLVRVDAMINGLRNAHSIKLCVNCLREANQKSFHAWPDSDRCEPNA